MVSDERDDQRLDVTKAFVLQIEHEQHIERGDDAAPNQRNPEEKLQARWPSRQPRPDRRPRWRARKESRETDTRRGVMIAAGLRQIAAGDDRRA